MGQENLNKKFHWGLALFFVTVFQILTSTVVVSRNDFDVNLAFVFIAYIGIEWLYFSLTSIIFNQNNFELEIIAFLFSGISLTVCASKYTDYSMTMKQLFAVLLGLAVFIILLCILRRTDICMILRTPVAVCAFGLLALNLLLAKVNNGALNWITVAGFSIQPSEIVKLAFIFVGAASLDKLQSTKSLTKYLIFSFICVGALFLMRDFGTALIFFFTFVIIAFMRSGDIRTIALVCVAAALGAIMIIYFRPTVASRFSTYRHVWENINDSGMQQSRVLIYSASGGLFGVGIGEGNLKNIFASTTDLVFGMICEEWGMITALLIILTFVFVLLYAIKVARTTRSAFYAIAACASAGLLLFQTGLNIFGVTDILPLTGVTLPFISRGGSSMICSWGLFAFIKAADIRTYPKLSKTILPDHPLYPADIRIGRRNINPNLLYGRTQTRRKTNPMMPIPPEMRADSQQNTNGNPSQYNRVQDIPVGKYNRTPAQNAGQAKQTASPAPKRTAQTRTNRNPSAPTRLPAQQQNTQYRKNAAQNAQAKVPAANQRRSPAQNTQPKAPAQAPRRTAQQNNHPASANQRRNTAQNSGVGKNTSANRRTTR